MRAMAESKEPKRKPQQPFPTNNPPSGHSNPIPSTSSLTQPKPPKNIPVPTTAPQSSLFDPIIPTQSAPVNNPPETVPQEILSKSNTLSLASAIPSDKGTTTPTVADEMTQDKLLQLFETDLNGALMKGRKLTNDIKSTVTHVRRILEHCPYNSVKDFDTAAFLKSIKNNYINKILNEGQLNGRKVTPKTLQNHLYSFSEFAFFVKDEIYEGLQYSVIKTKINRWTSLLKPAKKQQAAELALQKRSERVTCDDIVKVDRGESVKEAIAILDRMLAEDNPSFTIFEFSKVRAYLQYAIITQNACRTGIITKFDRDVYDARCYDKATEKVVFSMAKHKTSGSLGPADICICDATFRHLETYVNKIRSAILNSNGIEDVPSTPIFPAKNGKAQTASNVSNSLTDMFKKVGFKHRVTCTSVRHTAATYSFNGATLNQWTAVIRHMKHSQATHERFYIDSNAIQLSTTANNLITRILRGAEPKKEASTELTETLQKLTAAVTGQQTSHFSQDQLYKSMTMHLGHHGAMISNQQLAIGGNTPIVEDIVGATNLEAVGESAKECTQTEGQLAGKSDVNRVGLQVAIEENSPIVTEIGAATNLEAMDESAKECTQAGGQMAGKSDLVDLQDENGENVQVLGRVNQSQSPTEAVGEMVGDILPKDGASILGKLKPDFSIETREAELKARGRARAEQDLIDCILPEDDYDILIGSGRTNKISKEDVENFKRVLRSQGEGKEERLGFLEKLDYLEECKDLDCGLTISEHKDMGLGVHTTRNFEKGDVILEYCGRWIPASDFQNHDLDTGYVLFVGNYGAIDATFDDGRLGRLVNHSRVDANCKLHFEKPKDGNPRVGIVALKDIVSGTQLFYDYGDRRSDVLKDHEFLRAHKRVPEEALRLSPYSKKEMGKPVVASPAQKRHLPLPYDLQPVVKLLRLDLSQGMSASHPPESRERLVKLTLPKISDTVILTVKY